MATSQNSVTGNGHSDPSRQASRIPRTDDLGERNSREIKHRIDQTRGAMDETLDALGERLSPRHLLDDVISVFRQPQTRDTAKRAGDAASEFATNLGRQVRDNPIGVTLVGAGLAWLAFGNRHDSGDRVAEYDRDDYLYDEDLELGYFSEEDLLLQRHEVEDLSRSPIIVPESYSDDDGRSATTSSRFKDKASTAASTASQQSKSAWDATKSAASSVAGSVSETASATGEAISDAASSVVEGAKSATSSVAGKLSSAGTATNEASRAAYLRSRAASRDALRGARGVSRRAGRRVSSGASSGSHQAAQAYDAVSQRVRRAHDDAPLALGLGVMALGAIAGALLPRTRREDEFLGEASDDAVREVKQQAKHAYERGREVVERTVETAKDSAEAQGLTKDGLADRAGVLVDDLSKSLSQAAKDAGLHPDQVSSEVASVASDVKDRVKEESREAAQDAKAEAVRTDPDAKSAMEKS